MTEMRVSNCHELALPTKHPSVQRPSTMKVISIAGKLGEIVQGWTVEYGPCFVSAAISAGPNYDSVCVDQYRPLAVTSRDGRPVTKAQRAVKEFCEVVGVAPDKLQGHLELRRSTPDGKGRGSSSIDTYLAIRGCAEANDLTAHPREVYAAQCRVERSDPVQLADTLVVTQPEDGIYHVLGPQPNYLIVGWDTDPMGTVNTQQAVSLDKYRRAHAVEYAELLTMVRSQDSGAITEAATRSSRLNNQWLPKQGFDAALELSKDIAAGLLSAHTGTYLGLMLPPDAPPDLVGRAITGVRALNYRPELFLMGGQT